MAVTPAVPTGAGYSGTPLANKPGVLAGSRVCAIDRRELRA